MLIHTVCLQPATFNKGKHWILLHHLLYQFGIINLQPCNWQKGIIISLSRYHQWFLHYVSDYCSHSYSLNIHWFLLPELSQTNASYAHQHTQQPSHRVAGTSMEPSFGELEWLWRPAVGLLWSNVGEPTVHSIPLGLYGCFNTCILYYWHGYIVSDPGFSVAWHTIRNI